MLRIASVALLTLATTTLTSGQDADADRPDLLTFGRGTVFVSQEGLTSGSAGNALRAIDGDPYRFGIGVDWQMPVEFTFQLPEPTTFDRFAIPDVQEWPGNVTFVKSVTVSGSSLGPDEGYEQLVHFELNSNEDKPTLFEAKPSDGVAVRWVRIRFDGGIYIAEGQEERTNIRFTELIGNGSQEPQTPSDAFTGLWDFRLTERPDLNGRPLQLEQDGSVVTGCLDTIALQGTVTGKIARATGMDQRNDVPSSFLFVADGDGDGAIHGMWSRNRGRFQPHIAVDANIEAPTCRAEQKPKICGASVYVNFDVDSDRLRPESTSVLADLYERLQEEAASQVAVIGHTSTEGAAEHNLNLSQRRAQTIVEHLADLGFDRAKLAAEGRGETEPLIKPDPTETARELNRRVEIHCKN